MSISQDADLKQKLVMMRYFWGLGYWVKCNVDICNYQFGKKSDMLTDIDVFAIKFDFDFTPRIVIADCTTLKRSRSKDRSKGQTSRLFWVAGLMKYLRIEKAFLIRTVLKEEKLSFIGQKLNIIPIQDKYLKNLIETYDITSESYIFNETRLKFEQEIYNLLRTESKDTYEYIKMKYWEDNFSRQIRTLITIGQYLENHAPTLMRMMPKEALILKLDLLSLLSIAILKLCNKVIFIPENRREITFSILMGGETEYLERKKVMDSFFTFMKKEIKKQYDKTYPVSKNTFITSIDPPYFDDFYDLITQFCQKPLYANNVPRLLSILKILVMEEELGFNNILKLSGIERDLKTLKALRDILIFANRTQLISKREFDLLNSTYK